MMSVQSTIHVAAEAQTQTKAEKKKKKKRRIIQSDNIKFNSFEMLNPNVLGIKSIKFLMPNDKLNESRWWRAQRTFIECHASFDECMECQTYVCHATGSIIVNRNQVDVNVRSENKNRKREHHRSSILYWNESPSNHLDRSSKPPDGGWVAGQWVCVWVCLCVIYVLRSQLFVILTIIKNHNKRTRQLFVSLHRQRRSAHTQSRARSQTKMWNLLII